jgi:hypothetical protein
MAVVFLAANLPNVDSEAGVICFPSASISIHPEDIFYKMYLIQMIQMTSLSLVSSATVGAINVLIMNPLKGQCHT